MKNTMKSAPIFLAFLAMGFGDVVGPLTSQIQSEYELSNMAASLVTFMGFIMFGLLSVPLGIYQDRKGKKHVLQLGLIAAFIGLVLPIIANFSSFSLMLAALLLLGTGATMLQVAGNPIMRDVSPEGKYSRNLSFGQFVKAIGSLSGALIPIIAVNYFDKDWKILFPIYAVLIIITLVYLLATKIEEKKDKDASPASFSSCLSLLKSPFVALMVMGIFLYVGAEVIMSSKLPNYLEFKFNFDIEKLGLWGTLFLFLFLMAGRFLGGIILNWMKPKRFLIITTLLSLVGVGILYFAPNQIIGFTAIGLIGLGFANIFPLIFSITIDSMPERSNEVSGLMITAIIGGAFVPLVFGAIADATTLMAGFIVPAVCLAYILFVSLKKIP
ncbi:MAG: MFS transporter [Salinivirgaceae bacterium]|nr:MFS transporter [Salinivirgaceae bacterium]